MAAEADKKKETPKPEEATQAKSEKSEKSGKNGWLKYALFGGAGLVAVVVIAVATLFLVGGGKSEGTAESVPTSDSTAQASLPAKANDVKTPGDSATKAEDLEALVAKDTSLAFLDQNNMAVQTIVSNLDALDHAPTEADLAAAESTMSSGDSLAAVDWLSQEKAKLSAREKELDARDKDLKVRESKVLQGITRIEQAESTRTAKLAALYDGMDATAVAKLLANLDDETVVALLPRMKPKNASAVLALMPPARAAKLSKEMVTIAEN